MKLFNWVTNLIDKKKPLSKEEFILSELINEMTLTAHEEKLLENLVSNYPEIAEKVYRTVDSICHNTRLKFLIELTRNGYGKELIYGIIREQAYGKQFLKGVCLSSEEMAVRKWLACETDDKPDKMPRQRDSMVYTGDIDNRFLACTSLISEYIARECAYALLTGFIDAFKWPVRGMLIEFGEEYTEKFLNNLIERYDIPEEDCMLTFSGIYSTGYRTKKETEFYGKFVEHWMKNDERHYKETIMSIAEQDVGKKIIKKLGLKIDRQI